jgi:hypothetical protein
LSLRDHEPTQKAFATPTPTPVNVNVNDYIDTGLAPGRLWTVHRADLSPVRLWTTLRLSQPDTDVKQEIWKSRHSQGF